MKLKQLLLFIIILLSTLFASFSLVAQPTTTGMLAYFPLTGNTTKTAGSANVTATAVGTTYTTNYGNDANRAVQFSGNLNSYLDFVDNGAFDFVNTNFTVSFSFLFNGSATGGLIDNCLNYGGWGVWLWSTVTGTWNLQFNYKNNSVGSAAATAFTLNRWHHVAAVRNNGTISLYIDGIFRLSATEGTATPTYPINMNAGAMVFSSFSPPRYNPYNGKMDEIRIYNRALSASEVLGLSTFALPLKLGYFSALASNNVTQLYWETFSEEKTSHFEIEKSQNGTDWNTIGRVNASGNSQSKKNYSYTDNVSSRNTVFYRLKMIDADGTFTYSRVVAVKNNSSTPSITVFPNPATDVIQVQVPASSPGQAKLSIVDAAGRQYSSVPLQIRNGVNTISIPIIQLGAGNYFIMVEDKNGRQAIQFVKK